jgi:beta-1,4-mannosyl-glycoprotein beta-1,4-N-acetylglucosaminyltransferase
MSIVDCFLFNDELDLLEIRLHELAPVVDRFVIVESIKTFTGLPKPLYYRDNAKRFSEFRDRVTHVIVTEMPTDCDAWSREHHQRNAILSGLEGCRDNDTILVSDCDEIPRRASVATCRFVKRLWSFEQRLSYYYVNMVSEENRHWQGTTAIPYHLLKNLTPQGVRNERNQQRLIIGNGGWHFSYLGGAEKVVRKIASFSHQEYNTADNQDAQKIQAKIANGEDLFTKGKQWHSVPLDNYYPDWLLENPGKFAHLIRPYLAKGA